MASDRQWTPRTGLLWAGCGLLAAGCFVDGGAPSAEFSRAPIVGGQADATTRGVVAIIGARESCSGTLIAPNLVLTARHCVAPFTGGNGTVTCGTTNFGASDAPSAFNVIWADDFRSGIPATARSGVSQVRTATATGACGNDVALLILAGNVPNGGAIAVAPRFDPDPSANEMFAGVGYGITDPTDTMGTTYGLRRRVNGSVVCLGTACGNTTIVATEWQARVTFCSGDSGGPAMDTSGRVIGVASRANANCTGGVYATMSAWKTLIVGVALDAATAGGYAPPAWTGAPGDAGVADGAVAPADAGMASDARPADAGTVIDAGAVDAGMTADARAAEGGLIPVDAAAPIDAGAADANITEAGVVALDAGTPGSDSGGPPGVNDDGGCGCSTVISGRRPGVGALGLLALGVTCLARRRPPFGSRKTRTPRTATDRGG